MRASIVSVGSEILRGTLLDTNSNYFARELQALGVQVVRSTQVADDLDAIVEVLRASVETVDYVFVSGGLGPTDDDLTREALISLTGESPVVDPIIVDEIRERFRLRGSEMPQRNEKQAWKIPSAKVVPNRHGTAPGWIVTLTDTMIITMPGPPRENRPMWSDLVRPQLIPLLSSQAIVSRTFKTIGIGESAVADRLEPLIENGWPDVATYAKDDGVHITVTASHAERALANAAVRATIDSAAELLEGYVYGLGNESLAAAVIQPLAAAGIQMAAWEAGTAGSLLEILLSDSQAMHVVADGRIWPTPDAYANGGAFRIRRLARDAARSSGIGTAAAVAAHIDSNDDAVVDGVVEVALTHAGRSVDRSQHVRGAPKEIRRRAALFAAEVLWTEIRTAAGVRPGGERSSHSSST